MYRDLVIYKYIDHIRNINSQEQAYFIHQSIEYFEKTPFKISKKVEPSSNQNHTDSFIHSTKRQIYPTSHIIKTDHYLLRRRRKDSTHCKCTTSSLQITTPSPPGLSNHNESQARYTHDSKPTNSPNLSFAKGSKVEPVLWLITALDRQGDLVVTTDHL